MEPSALRDAADTYMPLPTALTAARTRAHVARFQTDSLTLLKPLLLPMAAMLAVLWLSRLGLALWQFQRIDDTAAWTHVWLQGLRFDAVLLGMMWVLPATLTPWMALGQTTWGPWRALLRVYGLLGLLFVNTKGLPASK